MDWHKKVHLLGVILLAALLFGCGSGEDPTNNTVVSVPRQSGSLQFTLTTTKAVYSRGEQIPLTLTVQNPSTQSVTLTFDGATYMTQILQGNQVVTQFPQLTGGTVGSRITLSPGQAIRVTDIWDQKVLSNGQQIASGQYTVKSWLPASTLNGTHITSQEAETNLATTPIQITVRAF